MQSKKWVGIVLAGIFGQVALGMGCSSSSPSNSGGGTEAGVTFPEAGGGGKDTGSKQDGKVPPPLESGTGEGGDGGGTCPADVSSFTPETYTAAVAHQGLCASTDLSAFLTACGDGSSATSCTTWIDANVAGATEGGAGTACGNCILNTNNNGAAFLDPDDFFGPNYAACIQLLDPTNGPTCAPAYDNLASCVGLGCDQCSSTSDADTCIQTVEGTGGGCNSYAETFATACKVDEIDDSGIGRTTCQPGGGKTTNPDWTLIINLVCGTADAG